MSGLIRASVYPYRAAGCAGTAVHVPGSISPLHNPFKTFITEQKTSFLLPPVRKVGPEQRVAGVQVAPEPVQAYLFGNFFHRRIKISFFR